MQLRDLRAHNKADRYTSTQTSLAQKNRKNHKKRKSTQQTTDLDLQSHRDNNRRKAAAPGRSHLGERVVLAASRRWVLVSACGRRRCGAVYESLSAAEFWQNPGSRPTGLRVGSQVRAPSLVSSIRSKGC